ncbi:MAG: hypothetical protein WD448_10430 [Woeseia sp.]
MVILVSLPGQSGFCSGLRFPGGSRSGGLIAAKAVAQEPGDAPDRGDADAGQFVNPAVGEALLQQLNDLPTVDKGLQFRRCAQIFKEVAAFRHILERDDRPKQGIFVSLAFGLGVFPVRFHSNSGFGCMY